ncbi:MAG: hypothetical protein M1831_004967 [Alyxoria varia]|nr:MAG: hypothetical protein M1831_004967 [Alyxoria varia]
MYRQTALAVVPSDRSSEPFENSRHGLRRKLAKFLKGTPDDKHEGAEDEKSKNFSDHDAQTKQSSSTGVCPEDYAEFHSNRGPMTSMNHSNNTLLLRQGIDYESIAEAAALEHAQLTRASEAAALNPKEVESESKRERSTSVLGKTAPQMRRPSSMLEMSESRPGRPSSKLRKTISNIHVAESKEEDSQGPSRELVPKSTHHPKQRIFDLNMVSFDLVTFCADSSTLTSTNHNLLSSDSRKLIPGLTKARYAKVRVALPFRCYFDQAEVQGRNSGKSSCMHHDKEDHYSEDPNKKNHTLNHEQVINVCDERLEQHYFMLHEAAFGQVELGYSTAFDTVNYLVDPHNDVVHIMEPRRDLYQKLNSVYHPDDLLALFPRKEDHDGGDPNCENHSVQDHSTDEVTGRFSLEVGMHNFLRRLPNLCYLLLKVYPPLEKTSDSDYYEDLCEFIEKLPKSITIDAIYHTDYWLGNPFDARSIRTFHSIYPAGIRLWEILQERNPSATLFQQLQDYDIKPHCDSS